MTHTASLPESAGTFTRWKHAGISCWRCAQKRCMARTWTSRCGGYEDRQFKCAACHRTWWVDGPDS